MLTTALLLMFASTDDQPAFLAAGSPRTVRLVVDEAAPPSNLPSYAGWSKGQLRQEYERLKETRPGIGLPIGLMGGGGGALTVALYLVGLGVIASGALTTSSLPFLVLFGIVGTGGAAMVIIGGILLARALPERRIYNAQMDEVDRLSKEGEDNRQPDPRRYVPPEAPEAPTYIGPPPQGPPPPPLPPDASRSSLQFPLIFARF